MKNNWQKTKIGEFFDVTNGKTNSDDAAANGEYPLFDRSVAIKRSNKYLFDKEAIIIPGEGKEFIPKYYSGKFDLHQRAYAVFPKNGDQVNMKYLYYWMDYNKDYLLKMAVGSTVKSLRLYMLQNFPLNKPDYSKQQKIADILSSVDNAIQKTEQIIQKTEELKNGLIRELLTKGIGHKKFKKTKLGEIPEEWQIVNVGQICDCIVPGRNKPKLFDGDIPWITTPNIKDSHIEYNNESVYVSRQELINCGNKIIPVKSVVMSCVGNFGIVAVTDKEIAINQQLHAFLPSNKIDPDFLKFALMQQKNAMENLATKTSIPYLNKSSCNSIPIVLPSLEEQKEIRHILSSLEEKVALEKINKDHLHNLKNGLMQDIFNQKVRIN